MGKELKLILSELQNLNSRMNNLEKGQEGIKNDLSDFKSEMIDFKTEMIDFKDEMTDFKVEMIGFKDEMTDFKSTVTTDFTDLKSIVCRIEAKQDAVFEQVAGLSEFRTEVLVDLKEIKENQKSTVEILGEHEVQIRSLRRRMV